MVSANCHNRTTPDQTWDLGTSMGPPWDFDGTSECLTLLEMRSYAKSPIKESPPATAAIAETPSLPQVPRHPIFTRNPLRIIDLREGYKSLSEAIIQLRTTTPRGGRGVSENLHQSADRARSDSAAWFRRWRKRP